MSYEHDRQKKFRDEITVLQLELQKAIWEMLFQVGNKLSPQEKTAVQNEFQEINEWLERLKTGLVWIAFFGKVSVGKSSLINALLDDIVADVAVEHDSTTEVTSYQKGEFMLSDLPGNLGDPKNEQIAIEEANKAHGLVFVIDGEPYKDEVELFELVHKAVPNTPILVFVNKSDVGNMTTKNREKVRARIEQKMMKFVNSKDDIIYGSAMLLNSEKDEMELQKQTQLLERMYLNSGMLGDVMTLLDPANRVASLSEKIRQKIQEARTRLARKFIKGFGIACVASDFLPFNQLLITPGVLASMVFCVFKTMGKEIDRNDAGRVSVELLKSCGQVLGAQFAAVVAADLLLDMVFTLTGPLGALIGIVADVAALGYFKYKRAVILGEVALEYASNGFSWGADGQEVVIKRCQERASEYYLKHWGKKRDEDDSSGSPAVVRSPKDRSPLTSDVKTIAPQAS
ncbi:small GTP-binding protein [Nostoc linckia NIES-25]|nr:small GTP-binding protein [Nostoc linckia NIES-25]